MAKGRVSREADSVWGAKMKAKSITFDLPPLPEEFAGLTEDTLQKRSRMKVLKRQHTPYGKKEEATTPMWKTLWERASRSIIKERHRGELYKIAPIQEERDPFYEKDNLDYADFDSYDGKIEQTPRNILDFHEYSPISSIENTPRRIQSETGDDDDVPPCSDVGIMEEDTPSPFGWVEKRDEEKEEKVEEARTAELGCRAFLPPKISSDSNICVGLDGDDIEAGEVEILNTLKLSLNRTVDLLQGNMVTVGKSKVRIREEVCRDAKSSTFRCRMEGKNQMNVALKRTYVPRGDLQSLLRSFTEIEIMEEFSNATNIVRVMGSAIRHTKSDTHQDTEILFIKEWCSGGSLDDLVTEQIENPGSITERRVLLIIRAVSSALIMLHSRHPKAVVHRNLLPSNVRLTSNGSVKIADLSCATYVEPRKAQEEKDLIKYTNVAIRPPEILQGHYSVGIGPPVDIWALGCMMYALAFGKMPFGKGSNNIEAIRNVRYEIPEFHQFSSKLVSMIRWMLHQHPADRPTAVQIRQMIDTRIEELEIRDLEAGFSDAESSESSGSAWDI